MTVAVQVYKGEFSPSSCKKVLLDGHYGIGAQQTICIYIYMHIHIYTYIFGP